MTCQFPRVCLCLSPPLLLYLLVCEATNKIGHGGWNSFNETQQRAIFSALVFYIPWHQRGGVQWFLKKEPVDTCVTSEMRVMFFLFYVLVFRLVCRESWVKSCGTNPLNHPCLRWRSCGKRRLLWPWTDGDRATVLYPLHGVYVLALLHWDKWMAKQQAVSPTSNLIGTVGHLLRIYDPLVLHLY